MKSKKLRLLQAKITGKNIVVSRSNSTLPWRLSRQLTTSLIGKKIYFYRKIRSTQKLAVSLADQERTNLEGAVIISERQTDGVGRAGKRWVSPVGGIWLSIILKPALTSSQSLLLMFLATLSVCEVIKSKTSLSPKIKWPNDVTIHGNKICGALVDLAVEAENICYAVIGIGINANNGTRPILSKLVESKGNDFYGITSLKTELGGSDIDLVDLIQSLLVQIEYNYDLLQDGFYHHILHRWKHLCETFNKPILIRDQDKIYEAIVEDIDLAGVITVRINDGQIRKIFSPEIIYRR